MLIRLLSSTYIGTLIKFIISRFRKHTLIENVIWESDFYHKTTAKDNLPFALLYGILAILLSVPWFTFIPLDALAGSPSFIKLIPSIFLALGYYILKGMPAFFRKMLINDSGIEISEFGTPIVSIKSHQIIAIIREQHSPNEYDLIYGGGYTINSLSSIGTKFSFPIELIQKKWQTPIWEVEHLNDYFGKQTKYSYLEYITAFSLFLLNPFSALVAYFVIFGPFSNIISGLLVLEIVSIYFSLTSFLLNRNKFKRLIEKNLPNSNISHSLTSPS